MKGFTLVEMLTVVLIIAILTSLALPQFRKVVEKSRLSEVVSRMRSYYDSSERLAGEFGFRSYERLLAAKGAANEKNYSFGRLDVSTEGCTVKNPTSMDNTMKVILNCKDFAYRLSLTGTDSVPYVVAKKLKTPYAGTLILLNRNTMQLSCQPASTDTEAEACDAYELNTNQAGVTFPD